MFKVGDKVRFVKLIGDATHESIKIGDVGTVVFIARDEFDEYPIELKINEFYDYGFKEEELELVIE